MIVDFPAPAHPATMNNVSKSFFCELRVSSMMDSFGGWRIEVAFDRLAMNRIERDFESYFTWS